ncbi:hypothetical protein B0T24DRAFT_95170 [Lasiosphaeria ovina]|uniref:Uncharacterized protein n=1 Tax=Lasiosphaeria ovina TaxID=92902 RepID=A0AAE0NNB9_9PEZI|nr:hypothetical protein B0T24DRAFT_95170 [Lasiosphaeria ovina]
MGDCFFNENAEALLLFYRKGLLSTTSWPYGPSNFNPLHFGCVNDAFADTLTAFIQRLDEAEIYPLLLERTRPGGLVPLQVAVLSGSFQCARALLEFPGSGATRTHFESELLPAIVNQTGARTIHYYTKGRRWWPYFIPLIGAMPTSFNSDDIQKLLLLQVLLFCHVHEITGGSREDRASLENGLRQHGLIPIDPTTITNRLPIDQSSKMAYGTLRSICGVVWLGQKLEELPARRAWPRPPRQPSVRRRTGILITATTATIGVAAWVLARWGWTWR